MASLSTSFVAVKSISEGPAFMAQVHTVQKLTRRNLLVSASGNSKGIIIVGSNGGQSQSSGQDLYLPFRPPVQKLSSAADSLTQDQMLQILRDGIGLWHEYADLVTTLLRSGFTPSVLDEITGITGVEQNTIVVAAKVYGSLKESGLGAEALSYYDVSGAAPLYELRTLSLEQRRVAAEYVAEQRMDAKGSRDVARALKEYERRKREEGHGSFSSHPGDALAFNYYRSSKEHRTEAEKLAALQRGLERAVTESAIQKVREAMAAKEEEEDDVVSEPATSARIEAIRLSADESSFRPIPVLASLEQLDAEGLRGSMEESELQGAFKVFSPAVGTSWVALPQWIILAGAVAPAAIPVADVSVLPSFTSSKATEAMLIVDRGDADALYPDRFYVAAKGEGSGLILVDGATLARNGGAALARVLLTVLPALPAQDDDPKDWE